MKLQTQRLNQKIDSLIDELLNADIADYSDSDVKSKISSLEDIKRFVDSIEEREQLIKREKQIEIEENERRLKEEFIRVVKESNALLQESLKSIGREGLFEFKFERLATFEDSVSLVDSHSESIIIFISTSERFIEWRDQVIAKLDFYVKMSDLFDDVIVRNTVNDSAIIIDLDEISKGIAIESKGNDLVYISSIVYPSIEYLKDYDQCIVKLTDHHFLDFRGRALAARSIYERRDVKFCDIEKVLNEIKEANRIFVQK